jgi:DNA processing protein
VDNETAHVVLNLLPGVGAVSVRRLIERFGSAERALAASAQALKTCVGEEHANSISGWQNVIDLDAELGHIESRGVKLVNCEDDNFPTLLNEHSHLPHLLYVLGNLTKQDRHAISIVGTRSLSNYGRQCAQKLGFQLAQAGYTVVSGLARGIDAVAHEAALAANGRTIAVLGSGLNHIAPPENRKLARRIVDSGSGAIVSQFPMDRTPDRKTFPIRNHVISGLSYGVLVIEGARRSGSLITASIALDQNRQVFAVPGQIDRPGSAGPNSLIQEGAKMVTKVEDVLSELSEELPQTSAAPEETKPVVQLSGDEKTIHEALAAGSLTVDEIIAKTGLPSSAVSANLLRLEMRRIVRQMPGNRFESQF